MTEHEAAMSYSLTKVGLANLRDMIAAEAIFGTGHEHSLRSGRTAEALHRQGYAKWHSYGRGKVSRYAVNNEGRAAVEAIALLISESR